MAIGLRRTGKIEVHQLGGFARLPGHGQGGVGFGLQAALVSDGVGQLVVAGGVGRGLAVLESQFRQRGDGDLARHIAILGIGGGNARHGVKLGASLHALILHAGDLRLSVGAGLAAGGGTDCHTETEQGGKASAQFHIGHTPFANH